MLGAPLLLAVELAVLYAGGSYAMGRLMGISGFASGALGRLLFYLLVFPGVVLHEAAHYLACLLTGTRVSRFAPFSPSRQDGGRVVLGYVRHERRAFPVRTVIGLAPVVVNPLGLLLATALLTPLTFAEVVRPSVGVVAEGIFQSGFLADAPLVAAVWAYLSLSFALGSVPSREDLSGLPLVLVLFGGGTVLFWSLGSGFGGALPPTVRDLPALLAGLYALPAAVAAGSALVCGLWWHRG